MSTMPIVGRGFRLGGAVAPHATHPETTKESERSQLPQGGEMVFMLSRAKLCPLIRATVVAAISLRSIAAHSVSPSHCVRLTPPTSSRKRFIFRLRLSPSLPLRYRSVVPLPGNQSPSGRLPRPGAASTPVPLVPRGFFQLLSFNN